MKIGLYFGSFNPIHAGHLIVGSYVANNADVDKVWFVVSPQNPFKKSSSLLNEYHRLHLVKIAIEDDQQLAWSDIEFKLKKPSFTIDTLIYLNERYPQHTFSIIMGSDSYQNIKNWKNSELLLNNYQIYVYQRLNFEVSTPHPSVTLLNAPLVDISSTKIREIIRSKKPIRYLVPDKVREEIESNGYYLK